MKKLLYLFFAAAFLLSMVGCAQSSIESAVIPPARIGADGFIHASLDKYYTFESAFAEADVVALIEVGNWLAEDNGLYQTYYEAAVIRSYKGDAPEAFTLLQDGSSSMTMKAYPLFTSRNELLVFLKEAVGTDYENAYWIMGSFTTILDVSYDADGNRYYMDRYGILGESMDISNNYTSQESVASALYAYAVSEDPIVADMQYQYPFIFSEEDINSLINHQ